MRLLLLRRRRVLTWYIVLSILATFVFFFIFKLSLQTDNENDHNKSGSTGFSKRLKVVPEAKVSKDFKHGTLKDFNDKPFITQMRCNIGPEGGASNRICKFQNICYSPNSDRFFAVSTDRHNNKINKGSKNRWQSDSDSRLLDLTTIDNHNVFYFEFDEDLELALREFEKSGMKYTLVQKKTFMFSRFVYNNVMHNIHDDFIGQFLLHRKYSDIGEDSNSKRDNIDVNDNYIFFSDGMVENPYDHLFKTLSKHPFIYKAVLKEGQDSKYDGFKAPPICFENLIVGNSKDGTWYDYGFFNEPQGPIAKSKADGSLVRDAATHLMKYYQMDPWNDKAIKSIVLKLSSKNQFNRNRGGLIKNIGHYYISIFSRTKDRLILNEKDVLRRLEAEFGLPVRLVQLEVLEFNEIIEIMSRTIISIGLHGSALIFAMFMPKNSILLEMFPYAVPGESYSPYRTLSWLPGIDITYRSWTNKQVTNNFAQIGQRKSFDNLTPENLLNILTLKTVPPHICCGNLAWNFRIYQDTIVDANEIILLLKDALVESRQRYLNPKKIDAEVSELLWMSQHRIKTVRYYLTNQTTSAYTGTSEKVKLKELTVEWDNPWRHQKRHNKSINPPAPSQYGIWIDEMIEEILVKTPKIIFPACMEGTEINLWIRPYRHDSQLKKDLPAGSYSQKFTLPC